MKAIAAIILTSVVYVMVYNQTAELWDAVNAAGMIILIYLVVLVYDSVKNQSSSRKRSQLIIFSAVWILGIFVHWTSMYVKSNYQDYLLHNVSKTLFHTSSLDILYDKSSHVYAEYLQTAYQEKRSIRDAAIKLYSAQEIESGALSDSSYPYWFKDDFRGKIFIDALSESSMTFVAISDFIDGEDELFENFDGSYGKVQNLVILRYDGVDHEIQN